MRHVLLIDMTICTWGPTHFDTDRLVLRSSIHIYERPEAQTYPEKPSTTYSTLWIDCWTTVTRESMDAANRLEWAGDHVAQTMHQ